MKRSGTVAPLRLDVCASVEEDLRNDRALLARWQKIIDRPTFTTSTSPDTAAK